MKKVVRLTESDLVRIVKRVISEQTKNGPVIPQNSTLKIDDSVIKKAKNFGIQFKQDETPKTFLEKLNKSNIGITGFHIQSEGWEFPVFPAYANISTKVGNFRLSFEPADQENGQYRVKWDITIPYKK